MELNELEKEILKDIVIFQEKTNGLKLERQLESLEVKSRDYTGLGIYVHFMLDSQADFSELLVKGKKFLSSPIEIYLDNFEYPISFELNLNDKGQFDFLEIVPNGIENWDGKYGRIKTTANTLYI